MRRTLLAAVVALVVAAPVAFAASSSNAVQYVDATGDTLLAPDITRLRMSNDDAGGLTLDISVANRTVFSQDMALVVFFDTKPGAGGLGGVDYVVEVIGGQGALFRFVRGDEFEFVSGVGFFDDEGQLTINLSTSAIGDPTTIRFDVLLGAGMMLAATGEPVFDNFRIDEAPNAGFYTYDVKRRLSLSVASVATSPDKPKAGGRYAVALGVTQSTLGGPVAQAKVGCVATLGKTRLVARNSTLRSGLAICAYALPANAAGRPLRVTVSVTVGSVTVKRTVSTRVTR